MSDEQPRDCDNTAVTNFRSNRTPLDSISSAQIPFIYPGVARLREKIIDNFQFKLCETKFNSMKASEITLKNFFFRPPLISKISLFLVCQRLEILILFCHLTSIKVSKFGKVARKSQYAYIKHCKTLKLQG